MGEHVESAAKCQAVVFRCSRFYPGLDSCPSMTTGLSAGRLVASDQEGIWSYLRCVLLFVKMQGAQKHVALLNTLCHKSLFIFYCPNSFALQTSKVTVRTENLAKKIMSKHAEYCSKE